MLLRKYQVMLIRDGCATRSLHVRLLWPLLFLSILILLATFFVRHARLYLGTGNLNGRLARVQELEQEQTHQLLTLTGKIGYVQDELARIRDFDAKLHVMFSDEAPLRESAAIHGSGGSYEFRRSQLFPLRPQALTRALRQCQEELDVQMRMEEVRQQQLMLAIRSQVTRLHLMPSIWPVRGIITSSYGYRRDPFTNASTFHPALDISAPKGTPVTAAAAGRVIYADWDGAYGLCVHVRHTSQITTRYAHLTDINVRIGQMVERGDLVGHVGSTGRATGSHLHYEVRINNDPVNPRNYILN